MRDGERLDLRIERPSGVPRVTMLLPALTLVLASATDVSALSLKVVSLDFAYPYYGEPGNTCQRGNVFVRAVSDPTGAKTPVVVRMTDSAGLTPGSEAVLEVRRAGRGKDGTPVYCSDGRRTTMAALAAPPPQPVVAPPPVEAPASPPQVATMKPVAAQPAVAQPPAPDAPAAPPPSGQASATQPPSKASACSVRLFNVIKKALTDNTFGPSEFDPESAFGAPEAVNCTLARSRVTNVLLLKMVKERHASPDTVVGAEWEPGSRWERDEDTQRRTVKVYLVE